MTLERPHTVERPLEVNDPEFPWDLRHPSAGEAMLRRTRDQIPKDEPQMRAHTINVLTQIARAQGLQGKLADADRTLDEAEKISVNVTELGPKLRIHLERGRWLAMKKTLVQARDRFLEVWKQASESGEIFLAIDAAHMMSMIETPKKRLEWTMRALEMAESSQDPRVSGWRGALHIAVALDHLESSQLARARESFDRAASYFRSDGATKNACLARCASARTLRLLRRFDEALKLQEEVLGELNKAGLKDGGVFEEMGECLKALGRHEEAEPYFKKAYELLVSDPWIEDNEPSRLKRLKTLGKVRSQ